MPKSSQKNSRLVLLAGFGGLLLLMAVAELDGVNALRQIQTANDASRDDFLVRTRLLERIRADVYVSGTYVRDYLLEPEPGKAEAHRRSLIETRTDMDGALRDYQALLRTEEKQPFDALTHELDGYWSVLDPVFGWSAAQRKRDGYIFLRDEVFPRRMAMLGMADRIGAIAEAQLNAGQVRIDATYRQFRRRLTVSVALTIGLGVLLAAFCIRQILALEKQGEDRYLEISNARQELKQLSARLVEAQEDERRSISRELHDEIGQALTGVLVEMANLSRLIRARDIPGVESKADEIKKLVENSIHVVRDMALLLRPSMLDDLGLVSALQWQARETSKRAGVSVRVAAENVSESLPEEIKTCVYRTVQEALHNAVQHAHANTIRVAIRQQQDQIVLSIEDDGKGFHAQQERGMGLLGMQERVTHLGGTFAVESEPGQGVIVRIVLPHETDTYSARR